MNDYFGESAGRSSKNPVKPTARRRNSEAERSRTTHLYDDPEAWPDHTPKNYSITLTKRGWFVLGFVMIVVSIVIAVALHETCWTGTGPIGYGRCPWSP